MVVRGSNLSNCAIGSQSGKRRFPWNTEAVGCHRGLKPCAWREPQPPSGGLLPQKFSMFSRHPFHTEKQGPNRTQNEFCDKYGTRSLHNYVLQR
ncbi:POTE ankyrin domain family member J [Frankliniella fusca]|uniref:POTE ankyrin domain family member J n=1 Tax=Frankliniella fusca TaxID=407009 RepID=A0AAE1HH63_9NEOP|nr:POTE ankyrin domain family member J [Frankliniella fusca]